MPLYSAPRAAECRPSAGGRASQRGVDTRGSFPVTRDHMRRGCRQGRGAAAVLSAPYTVLTTPWYARRAVGGLPPQLPVGGENSSSPLTPKASTPDALCVCRRSSAGRWPTLMLTVAAFTFTGVDHRARCVDWQ